MSTPHSSHWLGVPTSMTRNAFTSLCWSSPVSCDACGWKWNPKPETRTNQVALVSFTHCWNRGLHSLVWAKPDLYATPGTSRLKNLCILSVDLLKAYHINHIIFIVHLSIIPARDPKQCQNKNNEGSWYHGPIITHIAPHLSSVLGPDAAERRKVRELPRKHRIDRFTTDQNEHVCAVYIMQFTVVIPRTMFAQYIACNLQSWYPGPCFYAEVRRSLHNSEK